MMQKITTAGRILRENGFTGVTRVALMKLHVRAGASWLTERLIRQHNLYSSEVQETLKCPYCYSSLERTEEGLLCGECQDIYI